MKLTLENVAESDGLYSVVAVHGCGGGGGHFVRLVLRLPGGTGGRVRRRQRGTGETKWDTAKGGSGGRRGQEGAGPQAAGGVSLVEAAVSDAVGVGEP